jgi:hypothetical protein
MPPRRDHLFGRLYCHLHEDPAEKGENFKFLLLICLAVKKNLVIFERVMLSASYIYTIYTYIYLPLSGRNVRRAREATRTWIIQLLRTM